jgi:hypothetical protein
VWTRFKHHALMSIFPQNRMTKSGPPMNGYIKSFEDRGAFVTRAPTRRVSPGGNFGDDSPQRIASVFISMGPQSAIEHSRVQCYRITNFPAAP